MRVDYRRVAKVRYGGFVFDSKLERDVYISLGVYKDAIRVKPKVYLTRARILVIPDFLVTIDGQDIFVEAKGLATSVWRLKMRLWEHYGPAEIRVYKRQGRGITLTETITPKIAPV